MDRYIGIDYGIKRTGLAVSDPLHVFATALDTVDSTKIIDYLQKYAQKETISRFVLGFPVNMDGTPSEAQAHVKGFIGKLEKAFPGIPVSLEDERFTSVLAHRVMIDGGMKAKDRKDKASVDRISAQIILQSYMDRESGASMQVDPSAVPETMSVQHSKKRRR